MTPVHDPNLEKTLQFLLQHHEKEYHCHVRFVLKTALEIGKNHGTSALILSHASLLHDIGRGQEMENETHEDAGVRIARDFLQTLDLRDSDRAAILNCIENHQGKLPARSMEESVLISSDSSSKVTYHSAFMLLCKKETFRERAEWGKKYVQKGYDRVVLPDVRENIRPEYERLMAIYDEVLSGL